ncbi:MAG: UDP-N-acetylmuramate--L-alanine ligase [Bdellovibrionaceae bacterium]|nr:UDP-N-acetylmuramate--L-alanine ligase [Pseudobdellovibrionaceae bacterium]|tara:strand:- start:46 stop:1458 length:1413 start_codon:yes stop_codon:yes gene_type:complete
MVFSRRNRQDVHLYFIGLGGIGMSGIAEVFLNQGYAVSGSDAKDSTTLQRLKKKGAKVFIGHDPSQINENLSVVVTSSAVKSDNPEVKMAHQLKIPVIPRAEMLGELMRGKTGIAIAGTHGKTSTTNLLSAILLEAKLDPTVVIGGIVSSLGSNAVLGSGEFVVAEADESDGSFLYLPTTYSIITNIDSDHLDHYGSYDQIKNAFIRFVARHPFYGLSLVCGEDPGVRSCLSEFKKPFRTYGFDSSCDFYANSVEVTAEGSRFEVYHLGELLGEIELPMHGRHQVLNALGAIGLAYELEISFSKIQKGLKKIQGVQRRFQKIARNQIRNIDVIDDYGHHPTEIKATLETARAMTQQKIITVFQPHRYSRTQDSFDSFLECFNQTDELILMPIFSAGEDPIEGITSDYLSKKIKEKNPHLNITVAFSFDDVETQIKSRLTQDQLLIFMGAGSVQQLGSRFKEVVENELGSI